MRSTRATAAVERLKTRSNNANYSMARSADGMFTLTGQDATGAVEKLSDALPLDDFVKFVNAYGPQIPRRMTKADAAFEKQLIKKKL